MKEYTNIRIKLKEEFFEFIYAEFAELPFTGIQENFDELIMTFEKINFSEKMKKYIEEIIKEYDSEAVIIEVYDEADRNWNEEWEKNVDIIEVNDNIGITPSWKSDELDKKYKLLINPKMSFGTGTHATTRLMCKLAEKYVEKNSKWLDVGTGTGVLAILAEKLGAKSVFAFDNNDWAVENAKENVKMNECKAVVVEQLDIEEESLDDYNGIFSNLFLHLIIPSLPKFYNSLKKSNGILLVSGVLNYDEKELMDALIRNGFERIETILEDEWLAGAFKIKQDIL